ncbi:LysM peptidoglycan-binding domain-containing protein, partial [Oceanobacillus caeni]
MKKLVTAITAGMLIASVTVTNVSAAEVKVQKGDTLWDISREHNTTVKKLMDINKLTSTIIYPNQLLFINEQYTVQKGDTLSRIAYQFDVTVKDIKSLNNLTSDLIFIGQVLEIPTTSTTDDAVSKETVTAPAKEVATESISTEPVQEVEAQEPEEVEAPAPVTEPEEEVEA